jgi:hypothetical protein
VGLPDIPIVRRYPRQSAGVGILIAILVFFPNWVEPTWALFSDEPLMPILKKQVSVLGLPERQVGDVLAYLPPLIVIGLMVGIYVGSTRAAAPSDLPPVERGEAAPALREGAYPRYAVDSDGVRWEKVATYSDRSPKLEAVCALPGGTKLLFKPGGESDPRDVRELQDGDRIEDGRAYSYSGKLFCPGFDESHQHTFLFTHSKTYGAALLTAEARFKSKWAE